MSARRGDKYVDNACPPAEREDAARLDDAGTNAGDR
jgi:hypothetical protein